MMRRSASTWLAVHVDRADLAHAMAAGDGLVLDRGLPLRLGEDHDGRGLDVQAYSPGLDLAHQDRGSPVV